MFVVTDLVRRDPGELQNGGKTCSGYDPNCWDVNGDNCWHQATDNLAGTDSYGTSDANPIGTAAYTVPFAQTTWNNMLLASGDLSMYVVMERAVISECSQGNVSQRQNPFPIHKYIYTAAIAP